MIERFLHNVAELRRAADRAQKEGVTLEEPRQGIVTDYKAKQKESRRVGVLTAVAAVKSASKIISHPRIQALVDELDKIRDLAKLRQKADEILELGAGIDSDEKPVLAKLPKVPSGVAENISADYNEMMKCFESGCYRSAMILCGRILETVLHRKYYEITGNDLLEKSPGIGLGNLVSKLSEKNVSIDPALGNQIHLINQVRIHSVHHKKEAFLPNKQQTQAIILYTLDVVEKLFK